jgi:hypothetical protein
MEGEITFDLVMENDMDFVEGCYRLAGGPWQVFIFARRSDVEKQEVRKNLVWKSGVTGLNVFLPRDTKLNKSVVLAVLSETLDVATWSEVRGPDSIVIR